MNEQNTNIRPTKKQQELLEFIGAFINQHDYSPSYREIMTGCNYTSVATVALHVNNLIERGHLVKREHSARSLEVVANIAETTSENTCTDENHIHWLVLKIDKIFEGHKDQQLINKEDIEKLNNLVSSLDTLGLSNESKLFKDKLNALVAS